MADSRYYTNPVTKGVKGLTQNAGNPWTMLAGAIMGLASGMADNATLSNQQRMAAMRKRAGESIPAMAGGMEQNAVMPKLSELNYG